MSLNYTDLAKGLYTSVVSQSIKMELLTSLFVNPYVEHGKVWGWNLKLV